MTVIEEEKIEKFGSTVYSTVVIYIINHGNTSLTSLPQTPPPPPHRKNLRTQIERSICLIILLNSFFTACFNFLSKRRLT